MHGRRGRASQQKSTVSTRLLCHTHSDRAAIRIIVLARRVDQSVRSRNAGVRWLRDDDARRTVVNQRAHPLPDTSVCICRRHDDRHRVPGRADQRDRTAPVILPRRSKGDDFSIECCADRRQRETRINSYEDRCSITDERPNGIYERNADVGGCLNTRRGELDR